MDQLRNAQRAAFAVAVGLGLMTAAGPAVAAADEESPSTNSRAETGRAHERTAVGESRGRKRSPQTNPIPRPAAVRPDPGIAESDSMTIPEVPTSAILPAGAGNPAPPAPARVALPVPAPAAAVVTPRPAAAAALTAPRWAVARVSPARLANGGAAVNPLDLLTAAVGLFSREVGRFRQPAATATGSTVTYSVTNDWGAGHTAALTVKAGQSALKNWTVEFDTPAQIVNIWNGRITSHIGTHYVIANMPYNGTVAAGQTTSFGYQASPGAIGSAPTNIKVNGVAIGTAAPPTLPGISIADVSIAEGNAGYTNAKFTVTLSKAAANLVTVGYATANGTASAGTDYTAAAGTLTFAPGVTSQTIAVAVTGDTGVETAETFTVTLSKPAGATVARAIATATITNDDAVSTPGLSISDASVTEPATGGIAPGYLRTSGNQIVDAQGKPVQLASINWFGTESTTFAPHGLWTRGYKDMIEQMAGQGFNTIRLPYSSEMLHTTAKPNGIDFAQNPDLQGLSPIQLMDKIIAYAGQKGLRVVLDHHRSTAGAGTSENGLWFNNQYTEDQWVADWQMLAARYKDNPTVIGFDLHNEPYNGTWGGGGPNDWVRAVERAGNAVLAVNPSLLIFTEGVGTYKGQSYWWGGNLMGVKDRPITLAVPNRVVYSPHDYPNSVWAQPWFQAGNFGADLPNVFRRAWGFIYEDKIAPVWVGEFGTKLQDPKDVIWFEAITSYLSGDFDNNGTIDIPAGTEDLSWAFWAWNPNSGDTGGILADDWRTVNAAKMAYLKPIEYTGGAGTSLASFTVTLATPSNKAVTVQYATANGTATAGADYSAASGTLTFAPGETTKTITVAVMNDSMSEGGEDFHVMLSNPAGATLTDAMGMGTITDGSTGTTGSTTPMPPGKPATQETYVDIMSFGMFHGSSHTGTDALAGGRTAITTEALVAYNNLRSFSGLAPATLEDVGKWAFARSLTNNPQPWGKELQGVGLYYAMQGAKVGWIADDKYNPQIVADIERTARLGSADAVMAMVAKYGHAGFARYLVDNGYVAAFVDTLKMEPHYGGWMHDRANGRLVIEGTATAHDLNHLTVLSHDQTKPFMNDTWDWPQWPALTVSNARVIEYFQSMVTLGDPRGRNLSVL